MWHLREIAEIAGMAENSFQCLPDLGFMDIQQAFKGQGLGLRVWEFRV